jgi:hypothetical protein
MPLPPGSRCDRIQSTDPDTPYNRVGMALIRPGAMNTDPSYANDHFFSGQSLSGFVKDSKKPEHRHDPSTVTARLKRKR